MVYVVVEELIPESHRQGNVDLATVSLMVGFVIMMVLDVALGQCFTGRGKKDESTEAAKNAILSSAHATHGGAIRYE